MGLEEQLIKGAYDAAAGRFFTKPKEDHLGKLAEHFMDFAKSKSERKRGLKKDFNKKADELLKNAGSLGSEYYSKAFEHVEGLKAKHNKHINWGGRKKQKEDIIELNNFINEVGVVKEKVNGMVQMQDDDKISGGQTSVQLQKMNQILDGNTASMKGSNDDEIAASQLLLEDKSIPRKEKRELKKKIKELEQTNKMNWGWDVTYTDAKGNEVSERLGVNDIDDLQPLKRDDFSTAAIPVLQSKRKLALAYQNGEAGSRDFNENVSRSEMGDLISEDNLFSLYHDDLLRNGNVLKENLKEHPIITNITYESIRANDPTFVKPDEPIEVDSDGDGEIDSSRLADMDRDGVISGEEMKYLSEEDQAKIIDALSNPDNPNYDYQTSKEVAVDWLVENNRKEHDLTLYGKSFYEFTPEDMTKWNTLQEKQEFIKKDRSTPRPTDNKESFIARGGIIGAIDDMKYQWDEASDKWIETEAYSEKSAKELVEGGEFKY